ncbi:PAS domain-containing protein [Salinarchaeum chitinilyticum]
MSAGRPPVRVLYVTGTEHAVELPTAGLERHGTLDVEIALSEDEAISAIGDGFGCVVCSVDLPDEDFQAEDGFELAGQLGEDGAVSTVLVGEQSATELGQRAIEAGAVEYLPRNLATESPAMFAGRIRRVATTVDGAGDAGPYQSLPLPVLVGDDTVHYANDAACERFAGGGDLTGRPIDALFEDVASLSTLVDDGRSTLRPAEADKQSVVQTMRTAGVVTAVFVGDATSIGYDRGPMDKGEMLDSLLETIPFSIYFKDEQSRHVLVSEGLTGMNPDWRMVNSEGKIHHTAEDVLGKTDFDLYPSHHAEAAIEDDKRVLETGEPIYNQTENTHTSEGEPMTISTTKAPWYDAAGNVVGVVGASLEITDEERYQDVVSHQEFVVELILEAIGEHLEPTAQDVIDQLNAVSNETDASTTTDKGERVAEADGTIVAELESHIDYMATLAGYGSISTSNELVDLEEVADAAWAAIDVDASTEDDVATAPHATDGQRSDRNATLSVDIDDVALANQRKVRELLELLLENAIVHGGDAVSIQITQLPNGFLIADDGPGIPSRIRDQVTAYGFSTRENRTGRGLPLAQAIAGSMRWELSITDSASGGCRVDITDVEFE